ncbi:hypothetical protein ILT44_23675 [Microvirga sp. BT689]|uniref:hypothetical protein n=1 Tax=Microvirga arvi TaxID=2778731 RepID=UPI00194E006E|nr:hypothetical protein [Microvirga arvi]MBM6583205.1 hypothetical protein [Microvirga arvi]
MLKVNEQLKARAIATPLKGPEDRTLMTGPRRGREIRDALDEHDDAEHSAEASGSRRSRRSEKLIRFDACWMPQAAATLIDTMVITSPRLNAATVAAPSVNWPS